MDNDKGGSPSQADEELFQELLIILGRLDRAGLSIAALHICEALEALSPCDPRIPLAE